MLLLPAGAAEPQFTAAPVDCELRLFTPVTETDVIEMVRALPDKQCCSDSLPTCILKQNIDSTVPVLPLLLVSAARRCSVTHEGSIHHADSEEGRHGFGRR